MTYQSTSENPELFDITDESLFREREQTDGALLPIENAEDALASLVRGEFGDPLRFHLKTESYVLQLAYAYNKILSLSNSRTRILAHQVESTHRIVCALKQRFLIADEVGLGKTIEAGLVIKEMIYRYGYSRILISCPASLLYQWQSEMKYKFNEEFEIMDRRLMKQLKKECGASGNPWTARDKIICSLDFIKNEAFAEDLARTSWDSVIFDEAHRLRRDANSSTQAYTMAEIVSDRTRSLLLLSATPFRGKLEELYFLIALIDKNLLGPFQSFANEYCVEGADLSGLKEKLSQVVIRRTKRDIGGFTRRFARTVKFELYPDERHLYEETTKYVVEEFNRAMQNENRAVGFVMTVFQKLLDSSSYALLVALRNRRTRLEELLSRAEGGTLLSEEAARYLDLSDMDEDESVDDLMDISLEKTVAELGVEISTISRLIEIAERIEVNKKAEKLAELMRSLRKKGKKKFIIFTQFRTTQDFLVGFLDGFSTVAFNGSMSADEKERAILEFKNSAEVIIATEAGGEGRNMQFCDVLINYDLPWSPLKIEQRIGRIHRFGQPNDVLVYNFSTSDTVAERVLEVLTRKLKLFEESIGTPDVMLGEIEDELSLNSLFMELVSGRRKKSDINKELDGRLEAARKNYEKLSELTVTHRMDFNYDEYYRITLKERQFSNQRIEAFVRRLATADPELSSSFTVPLKPGGLYELMLPDGKTKHGTFDSQLALENDSLEFLAFGHSLVEDSIARCQGRGFGGTTGIVQLQSGRSFTGLLFNFIVTYKSVKRSHELVPVIAILDGNLDEWDLESLEREAAENELAEAPLQVDDSLKRRISENAAYLFSQAERRVRSRVDSRRSDMCDSIDFQIDPELEKIRESFDRAIHELEEKLELQKSSMKWYGKDMRSQITRTTNRIMKAQQERERLIAACKSYSGIGCSIRLLNAAIAVSSDR